MNGFFKSFAFAYQGIRFAWEGRNFRIQCSVALFVIILGSVFDVTAHEWLAIVLISGLVLAFEIFNSAIESIVNFVSPEFHPLAGRIKDLAAAAVLVLSFVSVIVGLIIFVPYILRLFNL